MSRHEREPRRRRPARPGAPAARAERGAAPAAPAARARGGRRAPIAIALVALGLAVAAALVWRARGPQPTRAGAPASPIDTMSAATAYLEGARLYEAGRALESLPYFRHVGPLLPGPQRVYHLQMVNALERAALQTRRDAPQAATRSSVERVALLREVLENFDAAERLSTTPRDLAEVRAWRANVLRVWGFPWEALLTYRAAAVADPSWTVIAQTGDLFAHRLHHPDQPIPGIDDDVSLPGAR